MKYDLQIFVAILLIPMAKTYRPVGHKPYGKFHHYVALAQDKGIN